MQKINFEDGQLVKKGYVEIDGTQYPTEEAEYDGATPLSAHILNKMQDNIEEAIDNIDLTDYYNKSEVDAKLDNIQALPTGGTTGQVLTKNSATDGDAAWKDSTGGDSLPVGTIVDYDGDTVPDGYEEVEDTVEQALQNKVDKVEGKALSTNDFTNEYKNKIDGIETNADKLLYTPGAGTVAAGATVRCAIKLPSLGILGVRVWKSMVETFKLYACVGSNGYACITTQLVELNYNSACKIEITKENAAVYVSITNTSSEAQSYRVVQINGYK